MNDNMGGTWIHVSRQGENTKIPWGITWPWATTVGASTIAVAVYKKGTTTDISDKVMPDGSHIAYGNMLVMKALKYLRFGIKYIISITIDIDGVVDQFFMEQTGEYVPTYRPYFILLQSGGNILLQSGGKTRLHVGGVRY